MSPVFPARDSQVRSKTGDTRTLGNHRDNGGHVLMALPMAEFIVPDVSRLGRAVRKAL